MCCVCVGNVVAVVVFSVTWVIVADGELTGTGGSAASDVRVVIEMRGVVSGEGVLCEMYSCLAGGGVGGEWIRGLGNLGLVLLVATQNDRILPVSIFSSINYSFIKL